MKTNDSRDPNLGLSPRFTEKSKEKHPKREEGGRELEGDDFYVLYPSTMTYSPH